MLSLLCFIEKSAIHCTANGGVIGRFTNCDPLLNRFHLSLPLKLTPEISGILHVYPSAEEPFVTERLLADIAYQLILKINVKTLNHPVKKTMRKIFFSLLLSLCLTSCADEVVKRDAVTPAPNAQITDAKTKASASITGLTGFKATSMAIPSSGLTDGKRFYSGGLLRANQAYNPFGISAVTKNGYPRVKFAVNPKTPSTYLATTTYDYHHRAEFTRWPWLINHPLGTEEWLGFSYIFPTASEGYTQNWSPVSIYQNHAGRVGTSTANPPALQLEIAYPKQIVSTDPWRATPLGGEIMIINNIRKFRYVAQGVRVTPGARINIVMQIVYGIGSKGIWNIWINGKLQTVPVGNVGSTVWPPVTSTDVAVGGNSKLGIYHHQLIKKEKVDYNASKGHHKMEVFMTDWNDVIRHPGDWDYKNTNAYSAVNTAAYP